MASKKKAVRPPIESQSQLEATSRGYMAGYNGAPRSSNPNIGTPTEQFWYEGWDRVPPEINAIVIEQKVTAAQQTQDSALTSI